MLVRATELGPLEMVMEASMSWALEREPVVPFLNTTLYL